MWWYGTRHLGGAAALVCGMVGVTVAAGQSAGPATLEEGIALRSAGHLDRAAGVFETLAGAAAPPEVKAEAKGEWGATLLQEHRFRAAEALLREAYAELPAPARLRYAVDLGNLAALSGQLAEADRFYAAALESDDAAVRVSAELDRARTFGPASRLATLRRADAAIPAIASLHEQAMFRVNLGAQAAQLGAAGLELAYTNLASARRLAAQTGELRVGLESADALAQLYEDHGRSDDAQLLTEDALAGAGSAPAAQSADILVSLDWRMARLWRRRHDDELAIAAYERAVDQIQAIRQDIPIDYEDGRSSFRATLQPIYLGLADLLLQRAAHATSARADADLRATTDVLELLKQAEMQDYLRDRCTVDAIRSVAARPGPGTAFVYPVVLADRLELIVEVDDTIARATVPVGQVELERTIRKFAAAMREDQSDFIGPSRQLYDWLFAPIEATLTQHQVQTLVFVSDGALRLIPVGALSDGRHFLIERMATATVTGLSMTDARPAPPRAETALVAGMSEAGPVVDVLDARLGAAFGAANASARPGARDAGSAAAAPETAPASSTSAAQRQAESDRLALPGVRDEVRVIGSTLPGVSLLNAQFTGARFRSEAATGDFAIVHIASHGYFGGSASDSFILTYDDLLTMDTLQALLTSQGYREHPIELLSLSACDTAEGDERSPLGISGAAMKARAKSVLGTLWPVEDRAARDVMEAFYRNLGERHESKAAALRSAQLQLLAEPATAHPFYWAPFVLIGNWL